MERALRRILGKLVDDVARPSRGLEWYWCDVDLYNPITTFQRVALVLASAKASGAEGKEVWINLTGGTNILNGALQLAASLGSSPARVYYLLTTNESCVHHTTPVSELGGPKDHFWVDLPLVYLDFSRLHVKILESLTTSPTGGLSVRELWERLQANAEVQGALYERGARSEQEFLHLLIQPLGAQRLVTRAGEKVGISPAWMTLRQYWDAIYGMPAPVPNLGRLSKEESWFIKGEDLR